MELNLRPASVIRAHEVERRRPFLIGAAACVTAALLGWSVFYMHAAGIMQRSSGAGGCESGYTPWFSNAD